MTLYDNSYQRDIANKVLDLYAKQIEHEKRLSEGFSGSKAIGGRSIDEAVLTTNLNKSGFARGYNRDSGYERVDGIEAVVPKKKGGAIAINTDHQRLMGGDFLSDLTSGVTDTVGKVASVVGKVAPLVEFLGVGKPTRCRPSTYKPVVSQMKSSSFSGGKKPPTKYNLLVKSIMEKKGLKMKDALVYIKKNNLHKK